MKAIVQDSYGSADVLELRDIDRPTIGDNDVLVRVHAAGVDPGVWHLMTGLPYLVRLAGYGLRAPKNPVRGRDLAGRVEAVGKSVTRFRPGDAVFGTCEASFAEYACAHEDRLALKPENLTFEQAAAVPVSALTALHALRGPGNLQSGQKVLIIGAAGGIGSFAVQLAKALGAEVTGVCSAGKADLVRSLGADHVIDYATEDFADGARQYDLILDPVGNRSLADLRRALTPRGTAVLVGGEGGGEWFGLLGRSLGAMMLTPFVGQNLRGLIYKETREDLDLVRELVLAGKVTPVIDRTYPLREAPDAIRYMRNGHARGKIVISVAA